MDLNNIFDNSREMSSEVLKSEVSKVDIINKAKDIVENYFRSNNIIIEGGVKSNLLRYIENTISNSINIKHLSGKFAGASYDVVGREVLDKLTDNASLSVIVNNIMAVFVDENSIPLTVRSKQLSSNILADLRYVSKSDKDELVQKVDELVLSYFAKNRINLDKYHKHDVKVAIKDKVRNILSEGVLDKKFTKLSYKIEGEYNVFNYLNSSRNLDDVINNIMELYFINNPISVITSTPSPESTISAVDSASELQRLIDSHSSTVNSNNTEEYEEDKYIREILDKVEYFTRYDFDLGSKHIPIIKDITNRVFNRVFEINLLPARYTKSSDILGKVEVLDFLSNKDNIDDIAMNIVNEYKLNIIPSEGAVNSNNRNTNIEEEYEVDKCISEIVNEAIHYAETDCKSDNINIKALKNWSLKELRDIFSNKVLTGKYTDFKHIEGTRQILEYLNMNKVSNKESVAKKLIDWFRFEERRNIINANLSFNEMPKSNQLNTNSNISSVNTSNDSDLFDTDSIFKGELYSDFIKVEELSLKPLFEMVVRDITEDMIKSIGGLNIEYRGDYYIIKDSTLIRLK